MTSASEHNHLRISWSSLRTHEDCRQKAALYRAGKKNPSADIRVFFHGTVVDRAMRNWLVQPDPEPGWMEKRVADLMDSCEQEAKDTNDGVVRWRSSSDRRDTLGFCQELCRRLEPILREKVLPYQYQPSFRFRAPIQIPYLDGTPTTIFLTGEMDILVRDDYFTVWDLKATKDESYWRKTIGQIVFYDAATFSLFGENTVGGGLIQPMCKTPVVYTQVSAEDRRNLMGRVIRMASDLWRQDIYPKEDSQGCSVCVVRHACPKFKPVGLFSERVLSMARMREIATQANTVNDLLEGNIA